MQQTVRRLIRAVLFAHIYGYPVKLEPKYGKGWHIAENEQDLRESFPVLQDLSPSKEIKLTYLELY